MSTPRIVEVLNGYRGAVMVRTELDGTLFSWTATEPEILGGGTISINGTETLDYNRYRRQGDQWQSYTPDGDTQKVSEEMAAHLDRVEQAAAIHKSSGPIQ